MSICVAGRSHRALAEPRHLAAIRAGREGARDGAGEQAVTGLGPYRLESAFDNETRFVALPNYFAAAASQPREIAEHHYNDVAAAIQALRSGEVLIVDRLGPWDAA